MGFGVVRVRKDRRADVSLSTLQIPPPLQEYGQAVMRVIRAALATTSVTSHAALELRPGALMSLFFNSSQPAVYCIVSSVFSSRRLAWSSEAIFSNIFFQS